MTIVLPMPVTAVPVTASVQALDGGRFVTLPSIPGGTPELSTAAPIPVINGKIAFNFQVASHPGLYRVLVLGLGPAATLQFWVQDAQRPVTNPWALNASHWQTAQ